MCLFILHVSTYIIAFVDVNEEKLKGKTIAFNFYVYVSDVIACVCLTLSRKVGKKGIRFRGLVKYNRCDQTETNALSSAKCYHINYN